MTLLLRSATLLMLAVIIPAIVSCTADKNPVQEEAELPSPEPASESLELRRPNPEAMEEDVAVLVEASWQELQEALSTDNQTAAARAEAYAKFGLVSFANGLVTQSETAFRNAVHLLPDDARWTYFLALIHEYTGSLDEAALGFETVIEMRSNELPALIRLGNVRLEQANLDDARAAYNRALAIDPVSAAAHYGLGRVASAESDDRTAVDHFEAALAEQPYADRINYLLGLAWRNLGEPEKAQAFLDKRGVNEPGFTDELFDEISGGQARIGGLWSNMTAGSQALVDGDYERAVDEFRVATQKHPNDPRSWQSLGMGLNRIGDRAGAEDAYLKALELVETNAVVHQNLASLLVADGRLDDAEQHLLRSIEIDPRKIDAYTALAQLLIGAGRLDDALTRYDQALALDPQSGDLAISRAEVLGALGRPDEALAGLAEAARANPLDVTVRLAHAMLLSETGSNDEATAEIGKVLNDAGDDTDRARAHYALGRVQLGGGEPGKAITSFNTAITLNPDHRAARLDLARILVRARRFEQALEMYEALLELAPHDDSARVEAARAAILLGRGLHARSLLETGAASEAASPRLLSALARLLTLSAEQGVRDPDKALVYARRSFDISGAARHAETVALCLAATGKFDEAVQLQERLIDNAGERVAEAELARMTENLRRYRARGLGRLPLDAR